MTKHGFIAIARGVLDHPVVGAGKSFSDFEAWVWLLFEAAWKPHRQRLTNGRAVEFLWIKRGQVSRSRGELATAWGWGDKRVRGFLDRLEREGQIARRTGHLQTVIEISNYELYQAPISRRGQQKGRQSTQ